MILVPAFVIGAGIVGAVLIVLGKAFVQNMQESGHKRLIMLGLVALVGVVAIVTYLGIELPR
jgi:membrane protein DedA with SNARE-associated domain